MVALTVAYGSRAAAEDAVLEAVARAWEQMDRGIYIESLPAWVATVARRLIKSGLRRRNAERRARARIHEPSGRGDDALKRVEDLSTLMPAPIAAWPRSTGSAGECTESGKFLP